MEKSKLRKRISKPSQRAAAHALIGPRGNSSAKSRERHIKDATLPASHRGPIVSPSGPAENASMVAEPTKGRSFGFGLLDTLGPSRPSSSAIDADEMALERVVGGGAESGNSVSSEEADVHRESTLPAISDRVLEHFKSMGDGPAEFLDVVETYADKVGSTLSYAVVFERTKHALVKLINRGFVRYQEPYTGQIEVTPQQED